MKRRRKENVSMEKDKMKQGASERRKQPLDILLGCERDERSAAGVYIGACKWGWGLHLQPNRSYRSVAL